MLFYQNDEIRWYEFFVDIIGSSPNLLNEFTNFLQLFNKESLGDRIINSGYICGYWHHRWPWNAAIPSPGDELLNFDIFADEVAVPDFHVPSDYCNQLQYHLYVIHNFIVEFMMLPTKHQK